MPHYDETRVKLNYVEDGKAKETVLEEERAQDWTKEFAANQTKFDIGATQTFRFHEVSGQSPLDDLSALVTDPEEQANIINTGLTLKQQRYVRLAMLDSKFTPVDGVYDLAEVCAQKSEGRVAKSPEEKAASALSKILGRSISTDDLASIISQLQAGQAA